MVFQVKLNEYLILPVVCSTFQLIVQSGYVQMKQNISYKSCLREMYHSVLIKTTAITKTEKTLYFGSEHGE